MPNTRGPLIDMTPDGGFIQPPKPTLGGIIIRLAMLAVVLGVAWVAFWTALFLLPFLILLVLGGYVAFRLQTRRWF
jgi:UDP-N-acetylmuramyl pentapeptide phosphotransferase/UDP-N-acetylglucosamine-1-phosphate transferase